MLDWLINIGSNYPDFWKTYTEKFQTKSKQFVVLSIETSGLNPTEDYIMSVGAIVINQNEILVRQVFDFNLNEFSYNLEEQLNAKEQELIINFIDFIGNATLIGHRIHFDIAILNEYLKKMQCGRLKNEALDVEVMYKKWKDTNEKTFTVEELLQEFKIEKSERNTASEDALSLAVLFLKLKSKLNMP
ncbi:DNA polymerase III subunit epsilon [Flavobacterium branchiophilum NBRC 15030 = ATCC 35035]|uniref:DNA polymerase-3 subunit epsilon n=1 Tax=Flavobacterium branchiophilum TaxID=55197 RepID=A0A543G7R0_9FLAO|nr:ribonuclease H-like domain-containing protein [Flavobacterium branchiophilum]OXA75980.1 DNA polymerase III subunit epsilon [Flavobacterium branchiophilum NBRC 15030 = ATCC 35035]TQM42125.1 DNA polymerase-3 subunit epsilon [Flavobacterium branchiophilum]GEM53898.1 DNA polymerase III subunit epsilon [Flavobacterium branchiophilum NBRC 15030 = ATCC 35035]